MGQIIIAKDIATLETDVAQLQADMAAVQADVAGIETDVAAILAAQTIDSAEIQKIDSAPADGLAGTEDSVAYAIGELERHFHNRERWWGAVAAPDETNAIEANVNRPFVAVSGNNTWGTAIPICGTGDSPVPSPDNAKFDVHRVLVTDLDDNTTPWRLRFIWGTGTSADAITAGQWTEIMVVTNAVPGNRAGGAPADKIMRRVDVGTKIWAQCWNVTNGDAISFFWGGHGYSG